MAESLDRLQWRRSVCFPADVDTVEENGAAGGLRLPVCPMSVITLCGIN